jgi:hypothetical protein
MRVRLFSRGSRWVWRLGDRRWLAIHRRVPAWSEIFAETLDLMGVRLGEREIVWRARRWWTIVELRLSGFSPKKQRLIAAGLLKAARYNQPPEEPCRK